jgi:hypothetical protein
MALPLDELFLEAVSLWVLLAVVVVSLIVLRRFSGGRLGATLRRRFVLGVPWGTLLAVLALLVIYYGLQGGNTGNPVVVGFRSWSYTYPLGMVLAPFAHSSESHLIGNLVSTLAFAPVAEYVWSHYPTRRGRQTFGSALSNPFVRILVFLAGVFVVGLATSVFIPGALIGFSGVVFAFAGFGLVTWPAAAIFALVGERVVSLAYFALDNPVYVAGGQTRFITPWFANVAIQGHALGLLVGVLLGLAVVRRRDRWPSARLVWFAVLVFAVAKSLHALYWYLGGVRYAMFRAIGLASVLVLALVIAAAAIRTDRTLVGRIDLSRRTAATGVIVCVVLAIGVVAVPYNVVAVTAGPAADDGVQVRDYTVTYAEDVTDRYVASVEIPVIRDAFTINTSGVIVTSDRRNAWEVVVPPGRLAVRGEVAVPVGGLGWRETVRVNRTGWSVVDGGSTYRVTMARDGTDPRQVFTADPVTVPAIVNGSRIQIAPANPGFRVAVEPDNTTRLTAPVPVEGTNVTLGDITFNRTGGSLRAVHDGTILRIARHQQDGQR